MNKLTAVTFIAAVAFIVMSCGDGSFGDSDGMNGHSCTLLWTNSYWDDFDMHLYHSDPRSCPTTGGFGEFVTAGGTLIQQPVASSTMNRPTDVTLTIHNTNNDCAEWQGSFGPPIATEEEDFAFADYLYLGGNQWGAQVWAGYDSGTGDDQLADCPIFQVGVPISGRPTAKTRVRYSEQW